MTSTFRSIPVEVQAVQFDGNNFEEVISFAGGHYESPQSQTMTYSFRAANPEHYGNMFVPAELWNTKSERWGSVQIRWWVLRGSDNHLFAVDNDTFINGYAIVEEFEMEQPPFEHELASLLNRYSAENVSGTPDFILAEFMLNVLKEFNATVVKRADWRDESTDLPALIAIRLEEGLVTADDVTSTLLGEVPNA